MGFLTEEAAIEAKKDSMDGGLIDFDGQNCEDECGGWDGESRRCTCGNRRVGWSAMQLLDGTWYAYAEAY